MDDKLWSHYASTIIYLFFFLHAVTASICVTLNEILSEIPISLLRSEFTFISITFISFILLYYFDILFFFSVRWRISPRTWNRCVFYLLLLRHHMILEPHQLLSSAPIHVCTNLEMRTNPFDCISEKLLILIAPTNQARCV